jgi:hypothetical protein
MIYIIGDSHVSIFSGIDTKNGRIHIQPEFGYCYTLSQGQLQPSINQFEKKIPHFLAIKVGSHTAYNSFNKLSKIEQVISEYNIGLNDFIFMSFGQIDIQNHLIPRKIKDNITIKESIPADQFIDKKDINSWVNEDGNLYCIGHIRYSTSDLRYNQPMAEDNYAIVHNGVISQDPPEQWEIIFGFKTKTHNDSELILRCSMTDKHPLEVFRPASMSVCTINNNKIITAYRNEARPLYYHRDPRMTIFASTADILKRSGLSWEKAEMYTIYQVEKNKLSFKDIPTNVKDLQ